MSDEAGGFDPQLDALCHANDAHRKASSMDHSDEIEMLEAALRIRAAVSPYSAVGRRTMRLRLLFLKDEKQKLLIQRASAGLLPLK